ncbi:Arylsulfatase [Anaerohalosphaera lusitana]|uniref:Arylsulfatase n=1 Tax=Anaerohalosphaera lusitana TaxID=1936003 RepID=A0A1U9NJH8_9BACT|nr:arylsulfatase [Anaerohalosphaera lusitana]AQT68079.1 Arylsulfatase [Anaerohalosphaera lusitana]
MNRREFLKTAAFTAGSVAAGAAAGKAGEVALSNKVMNMRTGRKRPNVIYILADDLGYADLGSFGQEKINTPTLDRMAAEGMRMTQHYSGSTVCAPARCSLMTGQHTGHCYIRGNATVALRPQDFTVAEMFKQHGYATSCIGKWGLGDLGTTGHPNEKGFDHFFGYLSQLRAHHYYTDYLWRNTEKVPLNGKTYSHDLMTQEALNFVDDNKDNPFFMYLAFTIPHAELLVPEDSLEEYRELGWPETPWPGGHYGAQETPRAAYAAMVTRMDRDIKRLFDRLKEHGIDEDTLVIFTSDNGPHAEGGNDWAFFDSNGPFRGIKRDLYEGGIREPMVVRWPGKIKPGSKSDHISAFWDFMPTCADLLGVEPPSSTDGKSFLPALLGKTQEQHEYLYWEFHEGGGKQAVRKGKWKGIRFNLKNEPNPPVNLYNLDTDPGETTNVASVYPGIAAELKQLMLEAHERSPIFKFYGE